MLRNNHSFYRLVSRLKGDKDVLLAASRVDGQALYFASQELRDDKEIVLTGIHTGRYGLEQNTNLETLLRRLVEIPGIFRIRLSSIEINEITDGIINLIKENKIMAKHLHIPLQSGSDKILSLMGRRYDLNFFKNKVKEIRDNIFIGWYVFLATLLPLSRCFDKLR